MFTGQKELQTLVQLLDRQRILNRVRHDVFERPLKVVRIGHFATVGRRSLAQQAYRCVVGIQTLPIIRDQVAVLVIHGHRAYGKFACDPICERYFELGGSRMLVTARRGHHHRFDRVSQQVVDVLAAVE